MLQRLSRDKCLLLICDIQDKIGLKTYGYQGILDIGQSMIKTANIFNIPIIVTQQKKKVFGQLDKRLRQHIDEKKHYFYQKEKFSMIIPQVQEVLKKHKERNQVILIGMQTQVCVLQTFLDLKQRNYQVYIPVDLITSIRQFERTVGLKRLQRQGAIISTYQSLTFQLLGTSKDQHFKEVLEIIKSVPREKAISHL